MFVLSLHCHFTSPSKVPLLLYEQLRSKVDSYIRAWADKQLSNDLLQLEQEMSALYSWKTEVKRPAAREKAKTVALFGNIQTRLSENRLKNWEPPLGLSSEVSASDDTFGWLAVELMGTWEYVQDLDNDWRDLLKAETSYMRKLDTHYRQYVLPVFCSKELTLIGGCADRLKQAMKEEYASVASTLIQRIQRLNTQIAHMSGSLQVRALPYSCIPFFRLTTDVAHLATRNKNPSPSASRQRSAL